MTDVVPDQPERISQRVTARLVGALDAYLAAPGMALAKVKALAAELDPEAIVRVQAVLAMKKGLSYRDGLFIQLAWGLEQDGFDHTQKGDGGRGTAQGFALALAQRHISGVRDAYQNIGKNTANLARGNVAEFDDLLRWMNGASAEDRTGVLDYLLATVALTARPVQPMPQLALADLTFVRVAAFFDDLFATPSGGAHEQFAVAAFLHALLFERGAADLWVKTKNINASDASAGTVADVQVVRGNRTEEAFEVSATDWRSKIGQALDAARNADLSRICVLAYGNDLDGLAAAVEGSTVDVSVMDVRSFVRLLLGTLKKPARAVALTRLYELLDRHQPNVDLVNEMVERLGRHALTA